MARSASTRSAPATEQRLRPAPQHGPRRRDRGRAGGLGTSRGRTPPSSAAACAPGSDDRDRSSRAGWSAPWRPAGAVASDAPAPAVEQGRAGTHFLRRLRQQVSQARSGSIRPTPGPARFCVPTTPTSRSTTTPLGAFCEQASHHLDDGIQDRVSAMPSAEAADAAVTHWVGMVEHELGRRLAADLDRRTGCRTSSTTRSNMRPR